jgi:hypothetical protein
MSNVNLTTIEESEKEKINISGGALTGLAAALMMVLAIWGFLVAYNKYYLQKKIEESKKSYAALFEQLKDKDSVKVIDFHRRLEISKNLTDQGKSMSDILSQVELQIVPSVFLSSFSFDDAASKVTLNCVADNFNTVAKQIYSFKKSGFFPAVTAGSTMIDPQTGRVSFPVELKLASSDKSLR